MITGSKEWFAKKAATERKIALKDHMESLRSKFIERFSPEKLSLMGGIELLSEVFDNTKEDSMMSLLIRDQEYRNFGAPGEYTYLGIVYLGADRTWKFNDKNNQIKLSLEEAKKKAIYVRDGILACVDVISKSTLNTFEDYKVLESKLQEKAYFYNYVTVLKYFQMLFPYYFPGMYSNHTLARCIQILGLKSAGKSSTSRVRNMGIISIFIRNCDIHNIVFASIYADEWAWEGTKETCPAAKYNFSESFRTDNTDKRFYILDAGKVDLTAEAEAIEAEIDALGIEGKERDAVVKTRVNQGKFRDLLIKRYKRCCLCGVSDPYLLVASHIKPWCFCEASEKLDINNGLLLCPNHDRLFDRGFISFDDTGTIIISDELSSYDAVFMNVKDGMKINLTEENRNYLKCHRDVVFQG